jgi:flagellar export protein FliJ
MTYVVPKTRLDRLVQLRERTEDVALENLAHAQSSLGRAAARLAGLRQEAKRDGRSRGAVELWAVEEGAHVRALQAIRTAERELAQALRGEQQARDGYGSAYKSAEVIRRAQEKKRSEILTETEKHERRALDELATLRFNSRH